MTPHDSSSLPDVPGSPHGVAPCSTADEGRGAPLGPVPAALARFTADRAREPARGLVRFRVSTAWMGGMRSDSRVDHREVGGRRLPADFTLRIDEPEELLGTDTAPNPQELLIAAYNACLTACWAMECARAGVKLLRLEVRSEGEVDLCGVLGVDPSTAPGCRSLRSEVRVRTDAPPETVRAIHAAVLAASPNRWNLACPVAIEATLTVE